jgi:putative acetyltransferase
MPPALRIRPETPADHARVHALQEAAFGSRAEADLVVALRASVQPQLSLVAEIADELVGHVFFSPVSICAPSCGAPAAGALAPIGVAPAQQGRGVGSALVRRGLADCAQLGFRAVFLVGDPAYYGRFGFELAAPRGLHYVSSAFDAAFQVRELEPGALAGWHGLVEFAPAFAALE